MLASCVQADPSALQHVVTSNAQPAFLALEGKMLFNQHCSRCHMLAEDCGYQVRGIIDRWGGDTTRLKVFMRNAPSFYGNDAYADFRLQKWKMKMPAIPALTDRDLHLLIRYFQQMDRD